MKFQLETTNRGASDEELIEDLRRAAAQVGGETISSRAYQEIGRFHDRTFAKRFGSWSSALKLAGLRPTRAGKVSEISDDALFENLREVWVALGRQPQFRDFTPSVSRYSVKVYRNRFGTLLKALNEFIAWVESGNSLDSNATEPAPPTKRTIPAPPTKRTIPAPPTKSTIPAQPIARRTRRDVTERQRFRILLRDGFRCLACGASPLRESGIQLHVDHIVPWSDGGETVDSNLQTKCSRCNLGKGSAFHA